MEWRKGLENTLGKMEALLKEISSKDSSMDMACGKPIEIDSNHTRDIM